MKKLIADYINGNIKDAKAAARRYTFGQITKAFREYGFSPRKASLCANFLKGADCWQAACDAE